MIKRAIFIGRSSEIIQEFHFAPPESQMKLHSIYNSHFTGSSCWDMTSRAGEMMEATYNKNIKITYNLPYGTHRNILPVISDVKPLRVTLAKRLLSFIEKIRKSDKKVLRSTLSVSQCDVRTVTGRNLRSLLHLCDKSTVQQLSPSDMDTVNYYGDPDTWRIVTIREILKARAGELDLPEDWDKRELISADPGSCLLQLEQETLLL